MRGRPELEAWGRDVLAPAEAVYVGSRTSATVARGGRPATSSACVEVPPGVDVDEFVPAGSRRGARRAARRGSRRPAEPRERRGAAARRGQRRAARGVPRRRRADRRLLREADREQGRPSAARGARRARRARGDRRLRRLPRRARAQAAAHGERVLFTGPVRAPPPRAPAAARRRRRRAVDLPGGVRHGRRRGRGLRLPAARRPAHRPRRGRRGARGGVPGAPPPPRGVRERATSPTLRAKLAELLALPAGRPRGAAARRRGGPSSSAGRGRAWPRGCSRRSRSLSPPWARNSAFPRRSSSRPPVRRSRTGTDFTVAVEEEFALLDPETLGLANRFEEVKAAAAGTELEPHLVGELIASEVEVRTGKCADFGEAAAKMAERRAQLQALDARARARARRDRHASVEPLAGPADHRHAALPPQRRAAPLRRLAQQHLRPPRARRDPRRRPRDRRLQRDAELPARAARALGQLAVRRGGRQRAPLRPDADLHPHVPPLRDPGRLRRLAGVRGLRRVPLPHRARSTSTPSSGGAFARTSPTRRSRSGSATRSPTSARRSRSRRSPTRSPPAARGRVDEGEPLPDLPHRMLEENLWRAIRYGLPGELHRLRRAASRCRRGRGSRR